MRQLGASIFFVLTLAACGGSTASGTADGGPGGTGGGSGKGGGGALGGGGGMPGGGGFPGGGGVPTGGVGGVPSGGGSGGSACFAPEPGSLDGDYLLTISTKLSPKQPLLFHAIVTTLDDRSGNTQLSMQIEPLDAHDRKTPVGPPFTIPAVPIAPQGAVSIGPNKYFVPGAANPITASDIEADVTLNGTVCAGTQFQCGDVVGTVTKPIALPLDPGSFWTLDPYVSSGTPPDPPLINCQKDPADPPPSP